VALWKILIGGLTLVKLLLIFVTLKLNNTDKRGVLIMHEIDNLSECLLEWKTLAKQHYKELERLKAENKVLWDEREEPHQRIALYISECNRLEAERDALRAAIDAAVEMIERLEQIEAAAQNLVKMKGRHNTEIAYQRLVAVLEESK
jgi:hypothetical protein